MRSALKFRSLIAAILLVFAFGPVGVSAQEREAAGSVQVMTIDALAADSDVIVLNGTRYQLPEQKGSAAATAGDAAAGFLAWDQWLKPGMEVEVVVAGGDRSASGLPRILRIEVAK